MRRISFLCFALIGFATSTTDAQEWARFRGPNGTGESETTTIPASWTDKDLNWKIELPGIGHSSPVLWGEKIFLLSADPKTATRYVQCISAADGKQIWRREYPGVAHHLHVKSSFASVTPAVDAERVFVAWSDPEYTRLMALDHAGNEQWSINLGPWVSQHGFGSSPMLYQDLVVINCSQEDSKGTDPRKPRESFIIAVEQSSGKIRWRLDRKIDQASYSVPCVRKNESGQEELVCCTTAEGIFAIDPRTGKEVWAFPDAFSMRTVSCPQLVSGLIIGTTGSGGGGNYLVAIKPGNKPEEAYRMKRQAPYVGNPVAQGDLLFLFEERQGFVSCMSASDGKTLWSERVAGGFFGSAVRAGDKLFCADEKGVLVCIAAAPTFKELGRMDLGEESRSTPAVANGRMYVRSLSHLLSVGGKK